MYVYCHVRKNNKPVQSENLTSSGQLFLKKGLFAWSKGTALLNRIILYNVIISQKGEGVQIRRCIPILGESGVHRTP